MNIFILSLCIIECAIYHCDAHCRKMITEYSQMLCSVHRILDEKLDPEFDKICYKIFGRNHPCTIWVRQSSENYLWLYSLFLELCKEYTRRYSKIHECDRKFRDILNKLPKNIPIGPLTPFAQAITNKNIQESDPVLAYRIFYLTNKKVKGILEWKTRDPPPWIPEVEEYIQKKYGNSLMETLLKETEEEKIKKKENKNKRITVKVIKDYLIKKTKEHPELKEILKEIL